MLDEAELVSAGGTLEVDEEQIVMEVGHWLATVSGGGRGCDQDLERCYFHADEQQTIRAHIRSDGEDAPGSGSVLRQNQRAARSVQLSVSADAKPTLIPMKSALLRDLSEMVSCPQDEAGEGELHLSWAP